MKQLFFFAAMIFGVNLTFAEESNESLFLTAGGKYTQEDIIANGEMTPFDKYPRFRPKHDHNPQKGDRICPITLTKANPECSWIIDGQVYIFCCPPCIDEFVQLAKESPEKILSPESYIK